MWSLSLPVSTLVSIVQARLQPIRRIRREVELWFQRGGMRPPIPGGASRDGHSLWHLARHKAAHCYALCTPQPCFLQLLAPGVLVPWMLSEMRGLAQSARTCPGLDLLGRPLDGLHGLILLMLIPGVASKRMVSAGQLCPFPGCQQELMGLCAQWTPFLRRRLPWDAAMCPPLCSGQKAGVGPMSWRQGGRKP